MNEYGNIIFYVSFLLLLVLTAFWLLSGMLLYDFINSKEEQFNNKKRAGAMQWRAKRGLALSSVFITAISVFNIVFLYNNISGDLPHLIPAITLNVVFYIGAVLSLVTYLILKHSADKDISAIRKYNFVLAFTTIVILADTIYTFVLSR